MFGNVYAAKAGTYNLSILYFTDPARPGTVSVNNGAPVTVTFPSTGSFSTLGAITQPVLLNAGYNTITISGSGSAYAPDIDSITVPTTTTQYLADAAQFNGKDISVVASPEGTVIFSLESCVSRLAFVQRMKILALVPCSVTGLT